MKETLGLDKQQTKNVRVLTEDLLVNVMALSMEFPRRDTSAANRQGRREATKELNDEYTAAMKEVLTEEQFEEYEKMVVEQRQERANRRKEGGGRRGPSSSGGK